MAYCSKCGQEIDDKAAFCPACGAEVGAHFAKDGDNDSRNAYTSYTAKTKTEDGGMFDGFSEKAEEFGKKATETFNEINDTPDHSQEYGGDDVANNKGLAVLSYFNLLVLIPIFAGKNSAFARFHANQGLILLILEALIGLVDKILGWTGIVALVCGILYLCVGILAIIGIVNAVQGKAKELPIVGGFKILS